MAKYDGLLLCSDFDGTLAVDGEVAAENAEALRIFMEQGGLFTLATGRPPYHRNFGVVPNTHLIAFNGAAIYDVDQQDKALFSGTLPTVSRRMAEELFASCDLICKMGYFGSEKYISRERGGEFDGDVPEDFWKIIFQVGDEGVSDAAVKIVEAVFTPDKYNISRSGMFWIEIIRADCTKGHSVSRLRSILGDRINKVICVGDFENDITMLREADIGYAVANAHPAVKAAADRITVSNKEHAIAKIISEL